MFSHIMVGATDIEASRQFYDATFAALGYGPGVIDSKGRVFYITDTGIFAISSPIDGNPATAGTAVRLAFQRPVPRRLTLGTRRGWQMVGQAARSLLVFETAIWVTFISRTSETRRETKFAHYCASRRARALGDSPVGERFSSRGFGRD